jgi:hypothetical protein
MDELRGVVGSTLFGADNEKIGTVTDMFLDEDTGEPEWLEVSTGWFGKRLSYVPIAGADRSGDNLTVPWSKVEVKGAPTAEAEEGLTYDDEIHLYSHYGIDWHRQAPSDPQAHEHPDTMSDPHSAPIGGESGGRRRMQRRLQNDPQAGLPHG